MADRLGDGPLDAHLAATMQAIADVLDETFNGPRLPGRPRATGFILMAFPFDGHEGRCNYVSNARREDVVVLLKEQLARFAGQPALHGRA